VQPSGPGWHPTARDSRVGVPSGADWTAKKLEERAEEIVDAYLRAGVDEGDWRALDALVNRVYGKPKETVVTEEAESAAERALKQMSADELQTYLRGARRMGEMQAATPEERRDLLRRWNEEDEARAKQPPCPKREDFERDTEYFRAYKAWNDERNHLRAVDGEAAAEAAG
jgi:sulfatase maturation enzyme AslB (radical SAM superfamily)